MLSLAFFYHRIVRVEWIFFLFSSFSFRIDSFPFHSVQYDYSWINFLLQKYCRTNESISFILFILEHWNSCSLTTRTHHIVEWYSNAKWVWVRKRVLYRASPLFFPRSTQLCVLNCFVFSEKSIGHLSFYASGIAVVCGLIENFVIFFVTCTLYIFASFFVPIEWCKFPFSVIWL